MLINWECQPRAAAALTQLPFQIRQRGSLVRCTVHHEQRQEDERHSEPHTDGPSVCRTRRTVEQAERPAARHGSPGVRTRTGRCRCNTDTLATRIHDQHDRRHCVRSPARSTKAQGICYGHHRQSRHSRRSRLPRGLPCLCHSEGSGLVGGDIDRSISASLLPVAHHHGAPTCSAGILERHIVQVAERIGIIRRHRSVASRCATLLRALRVRPELAAAINALIDLADMREGRGPGTHHGGRRARRGGQRPVQRVDSGGEHLRLATSYPADGRVRYAAESVLMGKAAKKKHRRSRCICSPVVVRDAA